MDWHILEGSKKKESVKVAFHIPILDEKNTCNYSYQTALKEFKPFAGSSVPNISVEEESALKSGSLYEKVEIVKYNANLSKGQKIQIINARYKQVKIEIQKELKDRLNFWGYKQDVE